MLSSGSSFLALSRKTLPTLESLCTFDKGRLGAVHLSYNSLCTAPHSLCQSVLLLPQRFAKLGNNPLVHRQEILSNPESLRIAYQGSMEVLGPLDIFPDDGNPPTTGSLA